MVNATPVGMLGIPGNPIPIDAIAPHHWVADVIYTPLETELIKVARAKGAKVMGGAGMCVHQAAETFRLFTGLCSRRSSHASHFCAERRPCGTGALPEAGCNIDQEA